MAACPYRTKVVEGARSLVLAIYRPKMILEVDSAPRCGSFHDPAGLHAVADEFVQYL